MTIANCPRCSDQVTVPASASPEATVRCPLCQEEFLLTEALAQLPPTLIVVSDAHVLETPTSLTSDENDRPWEALNVDDDAVDEIVMAPSDEKAPAAAFDFASGSTTTSIQSTAAIRSSGRSRKPKGSPIKSVLSIVIGGMMAFPIAQLILWYLPGNLKRDFGAGPIVARYVPAIVPAKFRGGGADSDDESNRNFNDTSQASSGFDFGNDDKFAAGGASGGESTSDNNQEEKVREKKQDSSGRFTASEEPVAEEPMIVEDEASASADVFGNSVEVPGLELGAFPTLDEPIPSPELPPAIGLVTEEPVSELPPLREPPPAIDAPLSEVSKLTTGNIRNAPRVSAADVVENFQAALSGNLAWDTDEASAPSGILKRNFYLSFSKLGESLTFADRSDEKVATQIDETSKLLHEIGKQADKLAVISGVANGWIAAGLEKRTTNGICVYGIVTTVEPIGELFETTIQCGGKPVAVVSTSDPSGYFAADRSVLLLGTILDEPTNNLGGYEGSQSVVVLDGYHVSVSTE
ncbi:MAG: hypothetical protein H8E66_18740 [Planctomycetes bacterium]|nr:hypothetical protein [Planctomycetota bacterium]